MMGSSFYPIGFVLVLGQFLVNKIFNKRVDPARLHLDLQYWFEAFCVRDLQHLENITLGKSVDLEAANLESWSTLSFSNLGICWKSRSEKLQMSSLTFCRYFAIDRLWALKYLRTCLTTSCESLKTFNRWAPSSLIRFSPLMSDLYLTLLFDARKSNWRTCSVMTPLELAKMSLALFPRVVDKLSICSIHGRGPKQVLLSLEEPTPSAKGSSSGMEHSVKKSTST